MQKFQFFNEFFKMPASGTGRINLLNMTSVVVLRKNVFVVTYVDRIILPGENCSTSAK
jgi:hypothetical protein